MADEDAERLEPLLRGGRWLAASSWLRGYPAAWLRPDIVAGVTLSAYLLPAGIADASLAGLPAEAGLYACLYAGLVFWLFASSRHTAITVTSAISILLGSTLGELSGGDPARHALLAAATALLVAALSFIAWLVRAGAIVDFVSETVMIGFKAGIALVLASTQLPKLCGFEGAHGDFWERISYFVSHVGETNAASLELGLVALALLLLGKRFLPSRPVALFFVIGGIALASFVDLAALGVKLLGEVPQGLPLPSLPALPRTVLNDLLPLAVACFMLGAVETAAIGRMFARKHGYRLDSNQEFLALAGANLAAGLGQGFPVSGGMSQSLVNETGGARTPLSGLVAAGVVLVVAVFFSGLLRNLPQPVLAAIVLVAVTGLVKASALQRLWRLHKSEFAIAMAALVGVLAAGILRGVLIGALISILMLLRRASRPHVAVLGRIPGTTRYSDLARNPDNEPVPGVLIFRVESSLLYFNVSYVRDTAWERVSAERAGLRLVVWDLSTTPHVDVAGAEMLAELHHDLAAVGIAFRIVEARGAVRDILRSEGLEEGVGEISRHLSLDAVLAEPRG
jgi:high affinity sulfate transporter 1